MVGCVKEGNQNVRENNFPKFTLEVYSYPFGILMTTITLYVFVCLRIHTEKNHGT